MIVAIIFIIICFIICQGIGIKALRKRIQAKSEAYAHSGTIADVKRAYCLQRLCCLGNAGSHSFIEEEYNMHDMEGANGSSSSSHQKTADEITQGLLKRDSTNPSSSGASLEYLDRINQELEITSNEFQTVVLPRKESSKPPNSANSAKRLLANEEEDEDDIFFSHGKKT
jgi:hypothetical protein